MRNTFIQELVTLARQHPQIALIVGDLGYSVVEPFAEEFPDRFINAGVSEQNMTGVAAGMASEGYHVFTYSIANFPTFRCAEQIRNDIAYHKLPVTIVAVGGGLAYGALGYSHHAVQDYALMRALPNMLIAAPGDPMEVRACMRYLVGNPGPSYLRLGKVGEASYHESIPHVVPGRWLKLRTGAEEANTILCTGAGLQLAMEWVGGKEFRSYSINSVPLWSMMSKQFQIDQMRLYKNIVSIEDHLYDGGFGSWLLESANSSTNLGINLKVMALHPEVCETVGSQDLLNKIGGIKPD
jgi:transketolase